MSCVQSSGSNVLARRKYLVSTQRLFLNVEPDIAVFLLCTSSSGMATTSRTVATFVSPGTHTYPSSARKRGGKNGGSKSSTLFMHNWGGRGGEGVGGREGEENEGGEGGGEVGQMVVARK